MILTQASQKAHEELRKLRAAAMSRTRCQEFVNYDVKPGEASEVIDGIGAVTVSCRKELVERTKGLKIRRRYSFKIDGNKITEKALYEKARAL